LSTDSSLKNRFAFKLASNVGSAFLGLAAMAVVPRALGPADYGRFEFLSMNFKLILDSLTLHVPTAFFNWISRKAHKEDADVSVGVTLYVVAAAILLFLGIIAISIESGLHATLWPDIPPVYLWEGFGLTVVVFLFQLCTYLADGKALTVVLEKQRLAQNTARTGLFLLLAGFGLLSLHTYFASQILVAGIAAAVAIVWLYRKKAFTLKVVKPWLFPPSEITRYVTFLKGYVRPLVVLVAVGFLLNYFDRWFLQFIGGSSQYGYFGLSDRLGAVAIIFTTAMTPLLTREFAFAYEEADKIRLAGLFDRIRIFLFLAAATSCFLSVSSAPLIDIIGGDKFKGAVIPMSIMALYPIHQTFGQLSSSLMIATGQTGLYAKIGIFCAIAGIPVTYFLMAPPTYAIPGMGIGATGLAIKMVVMNVLGTNIQLFYNTRYLDTSFVKWVVLQLKVVVLLYAAAWAAYFVINRVPGDLLLGLNFLHLAPATFGTIVRFGLAGLTYLAMVAVLVVAAPELAGVGKDEFRQFFRQAFSSVRLPGRRGGKHE
jgi:O-antigen/teichoic acid export membrane protein